MGLYMVGSQKRVPRPLMKVALTVEEAVFGKDLGVRDAAADPVFGDVTGALRIGGCRNKRKRRDCDSKYP